MRRHPLRAAGQASRRLAGKAGSTIASSTSAFRRNVRQLRESAIEPLPQAEQLPLRLRQLDWTGRPDGPVDAAAIVRRLRHKRDLGAGERNELGCAYALLAWERSLDQYWLAAIAELEEAAKDPEVEKRARANLEHVTAVSGFPL